MKSFPFALALTLTILSGCKFAEQQKPAATSQTKAVDKGNSVPVNQVLTPAGTQVELTGVRPQVIALSPDGKLLATAGKHDIVLIDPNDGKILQTVPLPLDKLKAGDTNIVSEQILNPDTGAQASYTGLIFSPDGK